MLAPLPGSPSQTYVDVLKVENSGPNAVIEENWVAHLTPFAYVQISRVAEKLINNLEIETQCQHMERNESILALSQRS